MAISVLRVLGEVQARSKNRELTVGQRVDLRQSMADRSMLLFVQASKCGSPYKRSCEIAGLATVVFSLCVVGGALAVVLALT